MDRNAASLKSQHVGREADEEMRIFIFTRLSKKTIAVWEERRKDSRQGRSRGERKLAWKIR